MRVEPKKAGGREGLRHNDRRSPVPAAHIRHGGPGFELGDDALKSRKPLRHQMGTIPGPKEALGAPKHRRMVVAPR
jgi:hypothetical protein